MERLTVTTPDGAYDILIAPQLLQAVVASSDQYELAGHVVIITDAHVHPLYAEQLAQTLPDAQIATMPAGEHAKNLDTVRDLYNQLFAHRADRFTTVVALGGGVVGDTAGFVAATYMRGVRFVQIPTTLLAMVDSSVGGKVGVDVPQGKNLVGAFKQPVSVLIDPTVLASLPVEQFRAGCAEAIKHGFIADPQLLDAALYVPERAGELVSRAIRVKIALVEEDPFEHSVRAYLNLGHTFGHAIEQVTQYAWLHGEAVAAGMVAAAKLSQRLGRIDAALVIRMEQLLTDVGLPIRIGALDADALYAAMATDKKWQGGQSRFVLLNGIGKPEVVKGVPPEIVLEILQEMRS